MAFWKARKIEQGVTPVNFVSVLFYVCLVSDRNETYRNVLLVSSDWFSSQNDSSHNQKKTCFLPLSTLFACFGLRIKQCSIKKKQTWSYNIWQKWLIITTDTQVANLCNFFVLQFAVCIPFLRSSASLWFTQRSCFHCTKAGSAQQSAR